MKWEADSYESFEREQHKREASHLLRRRPHVLEELASRIRQFAQ